jgi:hypothetical protein
MPIYWAVEKLFTLQILQLICVIRENLKDFEGSDPRGFEFSMLSFILLRSIPFQHQVSCPKFFLLGLLIKNLLDPLLMVLSSVHCLLPGLLDLH